MKLKITPAYLQNLIKDSTVFKYVLFGVLKIYFKITKPKNERQLNSKSILILSFHKLGDTTLTLPTVKTFTEIYSDAKITIACLKPNGAIYKRFLKNVSIIECEKGNFLISRIPDTNTMNRLQSVHANTIIDLTGSLLTMKILLHINAKNKIGINDKSFASLYTKFIPYRTSPPLRELYFEVIRQLSFPGSSSFIDRQNYEKTIDILIHPFAGWSAKEWNLEKYCSLYQLLKHKYSIKIISDSYNLPRLRNVFEPNEMIIANSPDELIDNLSSARMLICNDSGPMHLAAVVCTPTFTIYGPTNPIYHLPAEENHGYIQKIIKCSPTSGKYCYTYGGYFCNDVECLNELSSEEVYASVKKFLESKKIILTESIV